MLIVRANSTVFQKDCNVAQGILCLMLNQSWVYVCSDVTAISLHATFSNYKLSHVYKMCILYCLLFLMQGESHRLGL